MRDPRKSKTLQAHQTKKAMTDTHGRVVPPKKGPDDNPNTRQAGQTVAPNMPERDGPAKRTGDNPTPKAPPTSAKAKTMGAPKTKQAGPKRTSPQTAGMPIQGAMASVPSSPMGPMQMPPPNMISAMKASLGSSKNFKRP